MSVQPCSVPPLRVNRPDSHHLQSPEWAQAKEWFQRCLELESVGEADAEIDRQAKAELARL